MEQQAVSEAVASLEARLEELRSEQAFRNYEFVRERVLEMKSVAGGDGVARPSAYWTSELQNIEYMIDAGPLVIQRLRQHTYHVTGVWAYHYRDHQDRRRRQHEVKLRALHKLGSKSLFVPESPELGGFGFELDGALVNIDTLKFYEALIALARGEVLEELRRAERRPVIWEIGAGWGGFPYQFKTILPSSTYVITDFAELFLFSATYLMTVFPEARCSFYGDGELDWSSDFVFVPHTATEAVAPPTLDLAINMVSFQEMTTEQVRHYVAHAAELKAPFLYSLNRDRSLYNPELTSVRSLIEERYWLRPVELLSVSYPSLPDEIPKINLAAAKTALRKGKVKHRGEDLDYKHVIGWLRLLT